MNWEEMFNICGGYLLNRLQENKEKIRIKGYPKIVYENEGHRKLYYKFFNEKNINEELVIMCSDPGKRSKDYVEVYSKSLGKIVKEIVSELNKEKGIKFKVI